MTNITDKEKQFTKCVLIYISSRWCSLYRESDIVCTSHAGIGGNCVKTNMTVYMGAPIVVVCSIVLYRVAQVLCREGGEFSNIYNYIASLHTV